MLRTIEGIVHPDGTIELLEPVTPTLPRRVLVTILDEAPAIPTTGSGHRERVRTVLRAGGLLVEHPAIPPGLKPLTEAEREALLTTLPHALNLSQAVDEDREERY